MALTRMVTERTWTRGDLIGVLLLVPGLALAGYGGYLHFTIAVQVSAGQCDGCAPWHPLFVVAPLVVGVGLILISGYILSR